jgi:hypothetical protein
MSTAGAIAPTHPQKMLMDVTDGSTRSKSDEMRTTIAPAVTRSEAIMTTTNTSRAAAATRDSNDA